MYIQVGIPVYINIFLTFFPPLFWSARNERVGAIKIPDVQIVDKMFLLILSFFFFQIFYLTQIIVKTFPF